MRLLQALSQGVLIGDGANGTCLSHAGFKHIPYDLANLDAPNLVLDVHRAYFEAGSDFVETNTFQSNRFRMSAADVDVKSVNDAGGKLAREAAGRARLVLGAIGPIGKPIAPIGAITEEEVAAAVREQAEVLLEYVDGFILETYIDLNELRIAMETLRSLTQLPVFGAKAFIEDGDLIAEGLPHRAAQEMTALGAAAVGANCIVGPQRMMDLVRQMREATHLPIIAFPTPGLPQYVKGEVVYSADPDYFAKAVMRLAEEGAQVIGGCCGTSPEHIRQLDRLRRSKPIKRTAHLSVAVRDTDKAPLPETSPSELSNKIGKEFIVAVEMDVPKGLKLDRLLAGANALKAAGADVINISDGARARLRMNPSVVSSIIQDQVGLEVTVHFCCRDRNLLAVQSDLMGCHALGLRNILAVTGDPSTIGDYPSATSVFDVDSIGLCRILSRFNDGYDLAGHSLGIKTGFTIACAYNALAADPDLELDRLKRKRDAGAQLVYTQPVFSEEGVSQVAEACAIAKLPFLVGVLPLRNARHTEFIHNEVPGMEIPLNLREAMFNVADDADASEVGVAASETLGQIIRQYANGIYLMPPFGNHGVARRIIESLV